jgi:hypothetical protein
MTRLSTCEANVLGEWVTKKVDKKDSAAIARADDVALSTDLSAWTADVQMASEEESRPPCKISEISRNNTKHC